MTDVDQAIRRALSPEDMKAYDALGREMSPFQEALAAFQNQHWFYAAGGWGVGFALFGAGVFAGIRFLAAADLKTMLIWFGAAGLAALGLVLVKVWFWLEMQKNVLSRDLKRLEIQLAALAQVRA